MPNVTQSDEVDLAVLHKQFKDLSANADSFFMVIMAIMIYCEYLNIKSMSINIIHLANVGLRISQMFTTRFAISVRPPH